MAYRHPAYESHYERSDHGYGYRGYSSHHHPINLTLPMNTDPEPNIFLDLRDYFGARGPKNSSGTSHKRHNYHRDREISRTTDYIHESSTPRPTQRYSYHSTPVNQHRRAHTPRSPRYETAPSAYTRADNTEYVSPWDKSDCQMIKEGGWDNTRHFMESHGLSIYEPGDFDEAKDLLDGYRRVDEEAYREATRSRYHASPYADRYTTFSEGNSLYESYGSDAINDSEDDERIELGSEGQNAHSESTVYTNEYGHGWPDEQNGPDGPRERYASSDCDSTDAIDYDTESDFDDDGERGLGTDDCVDDDYYDEYDDDSIS